jgi:hypothetical protein
MHDVEASLPTLEEIEAAIAGADDLGVAGRRLTDAFPQIDQRERINLLRQCLNQRKEAFYSAPPAPKRKKK